MEREGPIRKINKGIYIGKTVDWLIETHPKYFMSCVKEWLDISPAQADLFERVSGGARIPARYIKLESPTKLYSPSEFDIIPNYDFDPEWAPAWWPDLKKRLEAAPPEGRGRVYQDYIRELCQDIQ